MTLLSGRTSVIVKLAAIIGGLALVAFHGISAFLPGQPIKKSVQDKSSNKQFAPDFSLLSLNGQQFRLSSQKGHMTDVIFFCACDRCHKAAKRISELQRKGEFQGLVSIIALDAYGSRRFQRETGLGGVVLTDPSDRTAELYDAVACPRLIVVADGHSLVYKSGSNLEGVRLQQALTEAKAHTARGKPI